MAFIMSATAPAWGQPLNAEIQLLLRDHPQIKAGRKTAESAKQEIDVQTAAFLPQVAVTADTGIEDIDNPTTRSTGYDNDWHSRRKTAGLTVTQNLFDGYAKEAATNSARITYQTQRSTVDNTTQAVIFEAVGAYIDVLRQTKLLELSRAKEASIKEQLELEDERVKRGSGISTDVLEAKQRLQVAKDQRVSYEGTLQDSISRYSQVFNHAPDIAGLSTPKPPLDLIPADVEEAVKLAQKAHPALESADLAIELAGETKNTAYAEYLPTIDLVGSANYELNKNATIGTRRDYSIIVQASWNAFTGFSTRYKEKKAAYDYGAAQDNRLHASRKITEATRIAWQAMMTTRERLALLENAVNIAAEIFDDKTRQRDAGKETAVAVLDAEIGLFDQRINYATASFDSQQSLFVLLYAIGRLSPQGLGII